MDEIDSAIKRALEAYDGSLELDSPFEELISLGELVDRLSIVNIKLFNLKDETMLRKDDEEFKAWSAEQDVYLVMERARLKRCIDQKIISMFERFTQGDETGGYNKEVKLYGDEK